MHDKPNYIREFTQLLDQSHVLKPLDNPIKQPHKGRPRGAVNKPKLDSQKSTKRDPSAWEYQVPKKKVGRPTKKKSPTREPEPGEKHRQGRPRKVSALESKQLT